MKKFLKYTLATFTGGIVAGLVVILFIFIGIAGIVSIASLSEQPQTIKDKTIFLLELNGPIVERASDSPFEDLIAGMSEGPTTEGLNHILQNIEKAAKDPKISGILLQSGMLSTGYATVEEIRNALIKFKESGKFIYSFAPVYTQKSYYLASVADKIYMTPEGMLEFSGIHSQRMFFKNTLDKLGVEMQIFKVGKYKSAVEPFVNEKMSDASREQTEVFINSLWSHVKSKISDSRNISIDSLDLLADQMALFMDQQILLDSKLIDGLIYKDELIDELKELTGTEQKDDLNAVSNRKYAKVIVEDDSKGFVRDKLAIIYASGEIDGGGADGIKSDDLSKTIRQARRDSSIKAIVLRINSPGGSALGSDIIWREVQLAKQTKPVVVSMGDLAASGGYYIACAADSIVAQPTTITGSIGIFGMIPNAKGLFNKLGLTFDGVKTNKYSDMPSIDRPFTKDEKELLQAFVERGYRTFLKRCADGRHTTTDSIDLIGEGRIWSGDDAIGINLVDKTGNINDAIEIAKRMGGKDAYRLVELPELEDPFQLLLKSIGGEAKAWMRSAFFGEDLEYLETIKSLKDGYPIQARLPYNMTVN